MKSSKSKLIEKLLDKKFTAVKATEIATSECCGQPQPCCSCGCTCCYYD